MLHWNDKGFGSKYKAQVSFILDIRELKFQVDCPVSLEVPNCTEMACLNVEIKKFPRALTLDPVFRARRGCLLQNHFIKIASLLRIASPVIIDAFKNEIFIIFKILIII